jgi:hypothetical protein
MKILCQGPNNGKVISELETILGGKFVNDELFKDEPDGHKFKPGDQCELFGLEDYPEFNGEIIEITAIRTDGQYGKAYYFKTDNQDLFDQLNWTYEYRLRKI